MARIRRAMRSLLAGVEQSDASISLSFVRDEEIRIVNREHRGKDKPTDVLSFPMSTEDEFGSEFELPPEAAIRILPAGLESGADDDDSDDSAVGRAALDEQSADIERMLGDIMISLDTAARQAADYDAPLIDEVERLLIHGVLHLLGHDHEETDERAVMEAEERRLASLIGLPWPYLDHEPHGDRR